MRRPIWDQYGLLRVGEVADLQEQGGIGPLGHRQDTSGRGDTGVRGVIFVDKHRYQLRARVPIKWVWAPYW